MKNFSDIISCYIITISVIAAIFLLIFGALMLIFPKLLPRLLHYGIAVGAILLGCACLTSFAGSSISSNISCKDKNT